MWYRYRNDSRTHNGFPYSLSFRLSEQAFSLIIAYTKDDAMQSKINNSSLINPI